MERNKLPLEELKERECIAHFSRCSGVRLSGLYGYVCEGCLAYARDQVEAGKVSSPINPCTNCGSTGPTYGNVKAGYYCANCSKKGIQTAIRIRASY